MMKHNLFFQTIPSASVILLLLTGVFSSGESTLIDIKHANESFVENEPLPQALPQIGPQSRNYVAYIPVPISDDEEDEEDSDDDYYDDEEYEDYEYYEEEEEEKPPPKRRRPSRNKKYNNRRKPNRRVDYEEDTEKVPFLVPLMMVPESEIGVDKKFSFAGDLLEPPNRPNIERQRLPIQRINNRPPQRPNCKILVNSVAILLH